MMGILLASQLAASACGLSALATDWIIWRTDANGGRLSTWCALGIGPEGEIAWATCDHDDEPSDRFGLSGRFRVLEDGAVEGMVEDGIGQYEVTAQLVCQGDNEGPLSVRGRVRMTDLIGKAAELVEDLRGRPFDFRGRPVTADERPVLMDALASGTLLRLPERAAEAQKP